jgi:hypothetical protein
LLGLPILPLSCLPLWGLRCACPCNNSIAYYATQCNSIGQIFLNYFALNDTRPGAPPAAQALEQALSWTIPRAHALAPVVSPGYPAGVGRKIAGQALLRFCPLSSLLWVCRSPPRGGAGRALFFIPSGQALAVR